ncbi:hypothetical protein EVA_04634 [gut metagenome]|uniref:Uncharacterized protein n=1 Tax=gut metagenome TaxID=749906 RepID=J9GI71_9ZZZZ
MGSTGNFSVYHASQSIFILQCDIHDVFFLGTEIPGQYSVKRMPLENLQFFHCKIREVLKQYSLVPVEQCPGIQGKFINLTPIDIDFTSLVHSRSRQLLNEVLEQRTVRQIKCSGIIDQGVSSHFYFYAGSLYYCFAKPMFSRGFADIDCGQYHSLLSVLGRNGYLSPSVLIAVLAHMDQILTGLIRNIEII